jgi:hypothetical protein
MFYQYVNSTDITVNCGPRANPDIAGIVIRISLYLQGLFSILLGFRENSSREVIFANIALQAALLRMIVATYFDSTIDVPHSIIAGHFAVMMSICRSTPIDLGRYFLQSKAGLKTVTRIWLLDIVIRSILLCFDYRLWEMIGKVTMENSSCQGMGKWVFLGKTLEVGTRGMSSIPLALAVLDIVLALLRVVGELMRLWTLRKEEYVTISRQIGFDSRLWWVNQAYIKARNVFNGNIDYKGWDWELVCRWMRRIAQLQRVIVCTYVVWTVEKMVVVNGIAADRAPGTFGQIFAIANVVVMFSVLTLRYRSFISFKGIQFSV